MWQKLSGDQRFRLDLRQFRNSDQTSLISLDYSKRNNAAQVHCLAKPRS